MRCFFFQTVLTAVLSFMALPAWAQLGDNLALNQPAVQSSQLGEFSPDIGVNGNLADFTHTLAGSELPAAAWWEVDLGADSDVGYVVLWNRSGCCGSRLRDIILQVRDDAGDIVYGPDLDFGLEPVDTPEAVDALGIGDDLRNPENEEGEFPLGPESIIWDIEEENGDPIVGRFLRVIRIPDPDNSGVGGQGNADESTVLQVGEFEVFETSPVCPEEGDTHCTGEPTVTPPPDNGVGDYAVTSFHDDDTGDILTYIFTATHEGGAQVVVGSDFDTAVLSLQQPGEWTITVVADDSTICEDVADDAVCTTTVTVEASETLTTDLGLIRTKAFSVVGPFTHDIGCGVQHELLDQNFVAPDIIQCLYPDPGDALDYDALEAASTGYVGPLNGDLVEWRLFNDGTTENGDQDLNGDVGAMDDVMGWICTYFEVVEEVNVEVCIGSDDGTQAWLNDTLLVSEHTCRGRGDCDARSVPMLLAPGQYRLMAGAWNRGGGWGLRLSLNDADLFQPIVDGDPRIIFHGPTRPAPLSEYPDCDDVVASVTNLECELTDDSLVMSWLNPDPAPNPIVITANGVEVETLDASAQSVTLALADLPAEDPLQICINNGAPFPTCCTATRNIAPSGVASHSSQLNEFGPDLGINLNFGDFTHTLAGNGGLGPAIWELDLLEPTCIGSVVVHNRDSCCGSRLRDVVVSFHDVPFTEDEVLDPLILEAADAPDPLWGDAIAQTEVLNPENILGVPEFLTIVFDGDLPVLLEDGGEGGGGVTARYVRITRLPDTDLSGGAGNDDEATVLSLGEVVVLEGSCDDPPPPPGVGPFIRGDCDQDGQRNLTDGIYLLNFLFLGGPAPSCSAACDVNSDASLNITTAVFLFNFLFLGGPAPVAPSPDCGTSNLGTDLEIGCENPTGC